VAFAIKKSDSVPIAETSGELFIIVFIRDIGNWSVPISQLPVTFSEVMLMKIKYFFSPQKVLFYTGYSNALVPKP